MGGGIALIAWVGTSLALAALARFWKQRSFLLWGLAAGLVYVLVEDPTIGPLQGGDRFLPIANPMLGMLSSIGLTSAAVGIAMMVVPQRPGGEAPRRRRRGGGRGRPGGGEPKQCPSCVETIRASAEICPFCGHRFPAAAAAPGTESKA